MDNIKIDDIVNVIFLRILYIFKSKNRYSLSIQGLKILYITKKKNINRLNR